MPEYTEEARLRFMREDAFGSCEVKTSNKNMNIWINNKQMEVPFPVTWQILQTDKRAVVYHKVIQDYWFR